MKHFAFRALTLVVTACVYLYSIEGCGSSSEAMKQLEKYEDRSYTDAMIVRGSTDDVYRASVRVFQSKEFIVTLSDPQTGLINAEKQSETVIPEDQKAVDDAKESPSVWAIIVGVLAIVLIVGLILILIGSCNDKESKKDSSSEALKEPKSSTPYAATPSTPIVKGYKYVVSLTLALAGTDSTEVNISATKMVVENGVVTGSVPMHNKYLNYGVFDAIYDQLKSQQ